MHIFSRMFLFAAALIAVAMLSPERTAYAVGTPVRIVIYDGTGQALPSRIALQRGSPRTLTAKAFDANGEAVPVPFTWVADPGDVASIAPLGDGFAGVTLTVTKDAFDDPKGFEPWTNVRACVGDLCQWMFVSALANLTGDWRVDVIVTNSAAGDQHLTLRFEQNGRQVTCTGASSQPMTAILKGKELEFKDSSGQLTYFVGRLNARGSADGKWRSYKDYEGVWHARKT